MIPLLSKAYCSGKTRGPQSRALGFIFVEVIGVNPSIYQGYYAAQLPTVSNIALTWKWLLVVHSVDRRVG